MIPPTAQPKDARLAQIESRLGRPRLFAELQALLGRAFGARFRGLVLYGSQARGDCTPESDVDIAVLLEGPIRVHDDLRAILDAIYPVILEGIELSALPVDAAVFESGGYPVYDAARAEGIRL